MQFSPDEQARQTAITLTQELVRIPSIYGNEEAVGKYLAATLEKLGFDVVVQPVDGGRCNVIGTLRGSGGGKSAVFQGHMDTMPVFGMDDEPYSGKLIDGDTKIFGRGSCDMKGGLASIIAAADCVRRLVKDRKGDIVLAFTIDEESQKKGIYSLVEALPPLDFGVCVEPTGLKIAICQTGCIGVKFTTRGRQCHGSTPDKGINAITMMARLLLAVENQPTETVHIDGVGEIRGTQAVTLIKGGHHIIFVPDVCEAWMDRRYAPAKLTPAEIIQGYRDVIRRLEAADPQFKAEVAIHRPDMTYEPIIARGIGPFFVPLDSPVVRLLAKAHEETTGTKVETKSMEGWTETDFLNKEAGVPTVIYGPGFVSDAHSSHENVPVEHLRIATDVYARMMAAVAAM
jgi:acetylornithine deacetylase/succinyl-diaminopimelate desuccinylase